MLLARAFGLCLLLSGCVLGQPDRNENSSGMTCDSDSCVQVPAVEEASGGEWTPFSLQKMHTDFHSLLREYSKWHNRTLYDASLPCNRKLAVVFTPNAGLGDSIGALTGAFSHALRTGRLFFIHWKPYSWNVGLRSLPFESNYARAKNLKTLDTGTKLLCVDAASDPASSLEGHITREHALNRERSLNRANFPYDGMMDGLIRPSPKVKDIVDRVLNSDPTPRGGKESQVNIRTVALVIRTGENDYNQFLSKGDETNFVKCFQSYAKQHAQKAKRRVMFRVFVTSDSEQVKRNAVEQLRKSTSGDYEIDVVTLGDSIIHVMHIKKGEIRQESVRERVRRTYAEFFLISRCQVLFLTHGSLFGRTAAEYGRQDESDVHFISDSRCDGRREKYSYLECHEPKYPKICGFRQ